MINITLASKETLTIKEDSFVMVYGSTKFGKSEFMNRLYTSLDDQNISCLILEENWDMLSSESNLKFTVPIGLNKYGMTEWFRAIATEYNIKVIVLDLHNSYEVEGNKKKGLVEILQYLSKNIGLLTIYCDSHGAKLADELDPDLLLKTTNETVPSVKIMSSRNDKEVGKVFNLVN